MEKEALYRHAFNLVEGIGPSRFKRLLQYYGGDVQAAWEEITSAPSGLLPAKCMQSLRALKQSINLDQEAALLQARNISTTYPGQADFPVLLSQMPDPPLLIYYQGTLPSQPSVTLVGSRTPTAYGKRIVDWIMDTLAPFPISIISGLALGIDGLSHKAALRCGLATAGILGSGIERLSPPSHRELAETMINKGGCVLSEFPPFKQAHNGSFPRRNRLLAAYSRVTVVIEAARQSGALITARYTNDYGREVFAVPGSIFSDRSDGCHELISQGAGILREASDLLEALGFGPKPAPQQSAAISAEEQEIYSLLGSEPKPLDEIRKSSARSSGELLSILSKLELKRLILHTPGLGYHWNEMRISNRHF